MIDGGSSVVSWAYYQTHATAVGLDSPLPDSLCAAINQLGGTKMLQLLGRGLIAFTTK